MTQPLAGLKVLDLTTLLPGPMATLMLAAAGAEVLKVERPGGDDMRRYPPLWHGVGAAFQLLNPGRRSVTLDLKTPEGARQLHAMLENTDILVEQFRPGIMEKLGFGYATVSAAHPRLIYCSISGYGQDGPRAQEAGHDLNYIGNTGLLALQPGPADRPVVPPALVADIGGGTFPAVINNQLALRRRDQTGQGCRLDIAMTDAMFAFA
jgi:crotonobetainyl-CoA:carnitine CoA-transferase CaiB-like acyl-CoA transferase